MGKTLAIVVLVFTAMILAGAISQGFSQRTAMAQSGRFADYAMCSVRYAADREAVCIIDTVTQRMLFFTYDINSKSVVPMPNSKAELRKDFGPEVPTR